MKKLLYAGLLFGMLSSCAPKSDNQFCSPSSEIVVKEFAYDASPVRKLVVTHMLELELDSSVPEGVIEITTDDNTMKFVQIKTVSNGLFIGLSPDMKYGDNKVAVRMNPCGLDDFILSSRVRLKSDELLNRYTFTLETSDSASVSLPCVEAQNIYLKVGDMSRLDFDSLRTQTVELVAADCASVKFQGVADKLDLVISDAARIQGENLKVQKVKAVLEDASRVSVAAEKKLSAVCSDSSSLNYKGKPEVFTRIDSEAASVTEIQPELPSTDASGKK